MKLLTLGNPKTAKGEQHRYLTAVLHLAPHKLSGRNLCRYATDECAEACLNTAGRGRLDGTQAARVSRSQWLREDLHGFVGQLAADIAALAAKAAREDLMPALRLNGTSDIPWENVEGGSLLRFAELQGVQTYDYTKWPIAKRDTGHGYHLTYSYTGRRGSWSRAKSYLRRGLPVAVVYRHADDTNPSAPAKPYALPATFRGVPVADGDTHDLTFLRGAEIIGLRAKGRAKVDRSPFTTEVPF